MPKRNCAWDNWPARGRPAVFALMLGLSGCATPQYAIRPTPTPEESAEAIQIERAISAIQAREFQRQGARLIGIQETLWGFPIQSVIDRLSRVTERPSLHYRAYLYPDRDPNAAALADGRIFLSTGMLSYLAGRGSRADELAIVLGHELAHTVAQHLVKRYRYLQQQQLLMALVAAGAAAATKDAEGAQRLALDLASMLQDVANSGYSQEQELEADQLGIRYVMKAGFDPKAALTLLDDFARFDQPWPFLRTHPYITIRRAYLEQYLRDTGVLSSEVTVISPASRGDRPLTAQRIQQLREAQKLYPRESVSWKNLQRQIEELERGVATSP